MKSLILHCIIEIIILLFCRDNTLKEVARMIRVEAGRNSVEANFGEKLTERNNTLISFFESRDFDFKVKKKIPGNNVKEYIDTKIPGIICADTEELIALALLYRNASLGDTEIKLGIDGGQGFLKVTASMTQDPSLQEEPTSKRSRYQDGYSSKDFKDTSVHKCLILACIPTMDESYPNLKLIMDSLKIDSLDYSMSQDIKVMLQVIGKQCAACTHPCPYCEAKKPEFEHCEKPFRAPQ